ncbi:peptidyl-prolyl cis-trans isomerase SurA [Gammaproteobacteria bacterium]
MIKKYFFCLLVFLMFSLPTSYAVAHLDKIVAVVNGDVITQSELDKRITLISRQLAGNDAAAAALKASALRKQALDSLIDSLLQMQLAQRVGMQISNAEIDNVISNIAKNNHLTVEQLQKSLQEHEGLSVKEYREQIREQLLIGRVQQQYLGKDIIVSDKEVEKALLNPPKISNAPSQYHVADILIVLPENASLGQIKVATDIATKMAVKLKQGADIERTVKEYSTAEQQVQNTDLGVRKIDELPALFAKEVAKMQVGQLTDPIKAPNGLHLLKLLEAQGMQAQVAKFTKERAQEFVFHQKLEERLKPWLKELHEAAYVKIID